MEVVNEGLLFKMIIFETKYFSWSELQSLEMICWEGFDHLSCLFNFFEQRWSFINKIPTPKWLDGVKLTPFRFCRFLTIFLWQNDRKFRFLWRTIFWYVQPYLNSLFLMRLSDNFSNFKTLCVVSESYHKKLIYLSMILWTFPDMS